MLLALASCETYQQAGAPASTRASPKFGYNRPSQWNETAAAPKRKTAEERPGLGTALGGEIYDSSQATRFYRTHDSAPDAVASFHYNDEDGAKIMAGLTGTPKKHGGAFELIDNKLQIAVEPRYGGSSSAYDHYEADGQFFVIGMPGDSYRLRLRNLTKKRIEVVVSVDGLDVLDAQPASVRKRGYVIDANASITIEGMRAKGALRELKFSTVAASHAARAFGEAGARNVGVIGVAAYSEDEMARRRANLEESYLRDGARAFRN